MELKEFKDLLGKHKAALRLLKEPFAVSKMAREVQDALEEIIRDYPVESIQSLAPIQSGNRRNLIIQDLIKRLKKVE